MSTRAERLIWVCCFILSTFCFQSEAFAEEKVRAGTGRAKIASGVVLTSVLTAAGALAVMSYGMGLCGEDQYDGCPNDYLFGGAAAMGVGLGVGIPLIASGTRDLRAWKARNRADVRDQDEKGNPFAMNIFVTMKKAGLLSLTYSL